jgi:hypothetical protein
MSKERPHYLNSEGVTAYSARYILEDADPKTLAEVCNLPLGVITAALRNILEETKEGDES